MRQLRIIALATAVPLLAMAGTAMAASDGGKCDVTVDRSQAAGTYAVTRQERDNGDCICFLQTGPAAQQSSTLENRIAQLQRDRECSDAPVGAIAGAGAAAGGAVAAGGAGIGLGVGTILPAAVAAAAGVAVVADNKDSPGG